MTRGVTANFKTQIQAEAAEFVHLLEADFSGGTLYFTTGIADLDWNGQTWTAIGGALRWSNLQESGDLRADGIELTLSGVDQTVISALLNENARGRIVKVRRAHLDTTLGTVVTDPELLFLGYQNTAYEIEQDQDHQGGTVTISTRVVSRIAPFRFARGIHANVVSHQHHFSGDTFFQHTHGLADKRIFWGTETPAEVDSGGGRGGGGGGSGDDPGMDLA